ncbi:MAG: ATP synthase F1 subunit gamma [Deltaproteobacteria bacterium]|nr:ATP synthase F1 subunit gamma [Deltaproteobacteria bacterium]
MPSLKSIKKRIGSVKNTQKITKAMKMVAAAKLRRAQQSALISRKYTEAITELSHRLIASQTIDARNPLTVPRTKIARREYLVMTSDRGLCGGFNSNLLRRLGDQLTECKGIGIETACRLIGKKGRDYFKSKNWSMSESITHIYDTLDRSISEELAKVAIQRFESGKTDEVWLVYNLFKSALVQEMTFQQILPLTHSSAKKGKGEAVDCIFEPSAKEVLDAALRETVVSQIHQAFLESIASELAARMTAMENATNNASDMIGYLTLQYNRARQASITKDLMDIVNGAEALR